MGERSVKEIDKAIASINKGADKKEEMRMMMAPYANWDGFLTPAPLAIALLGQLILISTETDFSLQDKNKSQKFTLLECPDSFRASLVQVSNKGWEVFNMAHTCMDQIRLYSGNVDKHVKTAVKFLISGSPQEVALMVPNALNSIENIANECLTSATLVEKEFLLVMQLVSELLRACTRAQGQQEQESKEVAIAIKVAEMHQKAVEQEKEDAQKEKERMMKQMKSAEDDYKDAMASIPSTGDMVMLACTDAFLGVVRAVPDLLNLGKRNRAATDVQSAQGSGNAALNTAVASEEVKRICMLVPPVYAQINALVNLACGGKNSQGKEEPRWNEIQSGSAQFVKKTLENIVAMKLQAAGESEMKTLVKTLCSDGVNICEELEELNKKFDKVPKEIDDVLTRARNLLRNAECINTSAQSVIGSNAIPNKSPHLAKQQTSDGAGGLLKSTVDSYRFKTATAKETLKNSREVYDKSCDDVARKTKEMGQVLAELAKFNMKAVDHEAIKNVLVKGMKALADLREQWGKLVQFFQMLANLVRCCLDTSLKTFVETSRSQQQLSEAGMSVVSDTMRDVIFEQAFQANQIAYVVNSISTVYVEVSDKHLMHRVTCLGKLIALDPVKDEREIQLKRAELNRGCAEAQEAIRRIANEKKKQIDEALDKRIGRIEREVEALLPPISETEAKEIQGQVKAAVAIGKAAIQETVDDLT